MKRIDKAYELFPDGVDLGDGVVIPKEEYVYEFCPYNLGVDDTDSAYYDNGNEKDIQDKGCRGITCEECWNKEVEETVSDIDSLCEVRYYDSTCNTLIITNDKREGDFLFFTIKEDADDMGNYREAVFDVDRETGLELINILTQKFK